MLADSSLPNAELTLKAIEEEGGTASVFSADVTKSGECRALVDAAGVPAEIVEHRRRHYWVGGLSR